MRRGLGTGWGGSGAAVPARRVATYFHDAAASAAAFADLAEESCGVGGAAAEAVLQVGLEVVDVAVGAALACGGEDLVEVGGQVVADGLAVSAQAVGDRADHPAAFS